LTDRSSALAAEPHGLTTRAPAASLIDELALTDEPDAAPSEDILIVGSRCLKSRK